MRAGTLVVVALLAAACSGGDDAADTAPTGATTQPATDTTVPAPVDAIDGTLPLAEQALDDPDVTTVATDLAESQVTGSTVVEPPTPPPCSGDDVDVFTARVERNGDSLDAVLRVRNHSDDWCEPDIGRSPLLDPLIEPDVWLFPGDSADLTVGQSVAECASPAWVRLVQIGIGEDSLVVPSAVLTCGWWLDAFVPLPPVDAPCATDDLQFLATDRAVLVRTTNACRFGGVAGAIDADNSDRIVDRDPDRIEFIDLYPGDLALVGAAGSEACDDPPSTVTIGLADGGSVDLGAVPCSVEFWDGFAAPWIGSDAGPLAVDDDPSPDLLRPFES